MSEVNWHFYDVVNQNIFLKGIVLNITEKFSYGFKVLSKTKRLYRHLILSNDDLSFSSSCSDNERFWNVIGSGLQSLCLKNCQVCDRDLIEVFLSCPCLESLDLGNCDNIFMSGCFLNSVSRENPLFPCLKFVDLHSNRYMSDALIRRLFLHAPNLAGLDVSSCTISFNMKIYQRFYPNYATNESLPSESVLTFQTILNHIIQNASKFKYLNFGFTMIDNESLKNLLSTKQLSLNELVLISCNQLSSNLSNAIQLMNFIRVLRIDIRSPYLHHDLCLSSMGSSLVKLQRLTLIWNENLRPGLLVHLSHLSNLMHIKFIGPCAHIIKDLLQIFCIRSRKKLLSLSMEACGIPNIFVRESLPFLPNLRKLALGQNSLTNESLRLILTSLPALEHLNISHNDIDDGGFIFDDFSEQCHVSRLSYLSLANTKITDETLRLFFCFLPGLKYLDLSECNYVTDVGLMSMSPSCSLIQTLLLHKCSKVGFTFMSHV